MFNGPLQLESVTPCELVGHRELMDINCNDNGPIMMKRSNYKFVNLQDNNLVIKVFYNTLC